MIKLRQLLQPQHIINKDKDVPRHAVAAAATAAR
jgi:hypothetical protein